jgi:hypothetical protein
MYSRLIEIIFISYLQYLCQLPHELSKIKKSVTIFIFMYGIGIRSL